MKPAPRQVIEKREAREKKKKARKVRRGGGAARGLAH